MNRKIPKIGLRIIKSAVAIALCFIVDFLRNGQGIVFYSQLSALWCMQVYRTNTRKNAIQRTIGTSIGAAYGLIFLLVNRHLYVPKMYEGVISAITISLMIIVVLYTTVLIKKKQASYFSCVVFLSIVVNHIGDANPYMFVLNRFLDTLIGILIGVCVNGFQLPRYKINDKLFISTMDETILLENEKITDYSKVELNRMIEEGMNFTVATMRTPAIICESLRDVTLKYPVIAMDGAVLYDVKHRSYIKTYVISAEMAKKVDEVFKSYGQAYFTNIVIDDTLLIYYPNDMDGVQLELVDKLRESEYRNYIKRPVPENEEVVYFMTLDKRDRLETIYNKLCEQGFDKKLKIVFYDSKEYEGYSYIKIFNKNATMDNMINYLNEHIGIYKNITFGTIQGKYDVVVAEDNVNETIRTIRATYEVPIWKKRPAN